MPHENADIEELRGDLSLVAMESEAEDYFAPKPSWRPQIKPEPDPELEAQLAKSRARSAHTRADFERMKSEGVTDRKEMVRSTLKLTATEVAKFVSAFLHDVGEGEKGFRIMSAADWNASTLHMWVHDTISSGFMIVVEEGIGSLNYPELNEMLESLGWELDGDWEEDWAAQVSPLMDSLPGVLSGMKFSVGDSVREGDVSEMPELHIQSGCQDCDFERGDPCMEHR